MTDERQGALKPRPSMELPLAPVGAECHRLVSIVKPAALDVASCSLDEFTVGECVGMGAFASVHKATRRHDKRAVVLKKWHAPIVRAADDLTPVSQDDQSTEEALFCFVHELDFFATTDLRHPSLVQGLGHGYCPSPRGGAGAAGFIAMEAAAGVDLRVELSRRRTNLPSAARWMLDLAHALSHLHAQRLIHRDVKPSNCMVSEEALVLVDYGLAVRLQRSDGEAAADGGDDSAMGMATVATAHQADLRVGVVPYMSPEQYRRRPYGQPVDVYAFGRILQEILLACEPDAASAAEAWLRELAWSVLPCPSPVFYERLVCRPVVGRGWPPALARLVAECQHASPAARPPAAAVAERMVAWMEAEPLRASGSSTREAGRAQVGDLRVNSARSF